MLEGHGSEDRLNRLRRAFRKHGHRKRLGLRGRAAGLAAFGAVIGIAGLVALDRLPPKAVMNVADVFYASCREAIQHDAAPLHRGQPGYRPELDADNDGVACEPYRPR